MLEKLKALFRARATDVEYERQADTGPGVVPAGPPTGQVPPVAPVNVPAPEPPPTEDEQQPR
jgi:hypothetical protein